MMGMRIILFLLVSTLLACSYTDRMPNLPDETLSANAKAAARSQFYASREPLRTLKALYVVRQLDPRISYRYAFVFALPDRARVEVLPEQGFYALSLFAATPVKAMLLDPAERVAYVSSESQSVFQKHFGLPLDVHKIAFVLSGQLPDSVLNGHAFDWYRLESGNIAVATPDLTEYWEVRPADGSLARLQIRDRSQRLYADMLLTGEKRYDGFPVPARIHIDVPLADQTIELEPRSVTFNQEVREALFSPGIPANYEVRQDD